jgi:hypothetical protein
LRNIYQQGKTMSTVFSHIVQKRLSQEYENVATEALAFILDSSEPARSGLMRLLRGIAPDLPSLRFRTQQSDDNARPDMWGYDDNVPRVFIENKFWAGLTENQPVPYLKRLAKHPQPTVLLMVVPELWQEMVWRELRRRVVDAKFSTANLDVASVGVRAMTIECDRILALTSWKTLLDAIGKELTDESKAGKDVDQLRSLCDAADNQAFLPISPAEVTDQRTPAFFLQLNSVVQGAVEKAVTKGILSKRDLREKNPKRGILLPESSWDYVGRYIFFPSADVGAWFGTVFTLWKEHGYSPLWLTFPSSEWGRGREVQKLLEAWANGNGVPSKWRDDEDEFAVGIRLATGEEEEAVIMSVAEQMEEIASVLSPLRASGNSR